MARARSILLVWQEQFDMSNYFGCRCAAIVRTGHLWTR